MTTDNPVDENLFRRVRWGFMLVACAVVYCHLFVLPATPIFYEEDHVYFVQDAWRMFNGEVIYRDFFEYTFPGTQVVYLALMSLFGTKIWLVSAVIFIQAIAQTALSLVISERIFGRNWLALLPPALFLFFGFRWFGIDGSHRVLSPIFIYLAIFVLLGGLSRWRLAAAGALCAVSSFFTQQRGVLAVGAIALFLIVEGIRQRSSWRELIGRQTVLAAGFAAALLVLLSPFVASAGIERFLDYTIFYIRDYVREPTANYGAYMILFERVRELGIVITLVSLFYYALIPIVYVASLLVLWRRKFDTSVLLVTLVGLALAVGTFAPTPARLYQICVPALICLVWLVAQWRSTWMPAMARVAVAALVLFGVFGAVRLQTAWQPYYLETPTGRVAILSSITFERYSWLSQNARPGEPVFEVYQCAVNYLLQHPNPTRVTFLLDNGYTPQWQVDMAVGDLEEKKPRIIIWDGSFSKPAAERKPDDHIGPLYEYLVAHYERKESFTPYNGRKIEAWLRRP